MTAWAVTEMLKSISAEYGLLTCIISDNGPHYTLEYFATEMHKLRIQHITTSPHHHQSNGLGEMYVKITKHILQKAKDTNEDPHLAMMVYQTIPLGPDQSSPREILHGCKAQSDLPLANAELNAKGLMQTAVESTKINRTLIEPVERRSTSHVQNPPRKKTWRQHCIQMQKVSFETIHSTISTSQTFTNASTNILHVLKDCMCTKWMDL